MTQATINITPVGPVEIKTNEREIVLVGALTIDGTPVNCVTKTVRRNKRDAKRASVYPGFWLKEIKPGYFIIQED